MKRILLCLALAMGLTGCGDPSGGKDRPDKPLSIKLFGFRPDIRTITIQIPELKGTNDAAVVMAALQKVEGFVEATPNLDRKTVDVKYDALKLGIKNVEFAIASAGYAAGETPAYPTGKPEAPPPPAPIAGRR